MTNGVLALLKDSPEIQRAFGNRFYPLVLPDGEKQLSMVYQLISNPAEQTLDGPLNFFTARLQVKTWARSYLDATDGGKAIREAFEGFVGLLPDGTKVHGVTCDTFADAYDSVPKLCGTEADYIVMYSNPA